MDSRFRELFNAMRKDMILMENFGYDEELLKTELSTCSEEAFREFERIYRERNKENNDMNEREYIIAKAKELGITAEELGVEDYKANLIQLRNNCQFVSDQRDELIIALRKLIVSCEIDPETAREYVSPDYWEDLGIAEKKYKIFKVTVKKTIYKDIYVAMPEDEYDYNVTEYLDNIDNIDNDYPDDEEEWEVDDYVLDEDDLTEDEVNNRGDDIWNYDDFAE